VVERLKSEYQVQVEWRPFYLRPDTPPEGMDLPDYVLRGRAHGSEQRLQEIARSNGMEFKSVERLYNTRLAHECAEFARAQGRANTFHRILFRKVYADGLDISRWDVLRGAAAEAGLDPDAMQQEVGSGTYTEEVARQVREAYRLGITGVPTYVINDRYAIVGAQPYEVFQRALQRILSP
jgi:predicted DsbA family dithiol-disulfide isomerase